VLVYAAFAIGHEVGSALQVVGISGSYLRISIRDSARIGPARVQCPFQGRALYEASCGVSPVLPWAPGPASLGTAGTVTVPGHWVPVRRLAFPPGECPCTARGRAIFALSACSGQPGQAARRWPLKPFEAPVTRVCVCVYGPALHDDGTFGVCLEPCLETALNEARRSSARLFGGSWDLLCAHSCV